MVTMPDIVPPLGGTPALDCDVLSLLNDIPDDVNVADMLFL
jgi:hypothetical protein